MANAKCKKAIREDQSGVDFNFADGRVISVVLANLSEEIITNLVLHGISQKVGDSYAGSESAEEAHDKCAALVERLMAGDWKTVRAAGGKGRVTALLVALCRATGKTEEECRDVLEGMDDDEKAQLRQHEAIKPHLAAIAAEKAAAKAEKAAADAAESGATLDL